MAEAAVEENPIIVNKFFCHHCNSEIGRILENYTCPTCNSGFIEELDNTQTAEDSESFSEDDDEEDDVLAVINDIVTGRIDRGFRPNFRTLSFTDLTQHDRGRRSRRQRPHRVDTLENALQDFLVNLGPGYSTNLWTNPHGSGPFRYVVGNPGDYAWGREGLDAIVTQLLNQMDVAGPPPLDKEKIKEIPVAVITESQVEAKLQCSVCWEDFQHGENVRKLECEHVYHDNCIVPWLQLHGTCPICRKSLSPEQEERMGGASGVGPTAPDFSAIMRGGGRWGALVSAPNSSSSSSSSTSSSAYTPASSSSSTTSNSSTSQRANPPSDNDMELDFG